MPGLNTNNKTWLMRTGVARAALGILTLLLGTSALAAVSDSAFSAFSTGTNANSSGKTSGSNQIAILRFNSGQQTEALQLWLTLAEQGDADAQFTLGTLYNRGGAGVGKDMIEAVRWYRKAAEQGHVIAQFNMGVLCATGTGVIRDLNAAAQWWRMAALQGHTEAQFNLGLYYAEGTGVQQDPTEAVKWWGLAAKQGYPAAQFNLGLMYMKGEGVDENPDEALRLWRLSANQGFIQAITVLKVLNLNP